MIICGDCIEVMRGMESNSVDTVITDPPYGLKFMGKKWDYDIPSIEIWEECLRVAKPGSTLLCFGGSRTYHRMACAIEDAGWVIKDCIMWLYGSGFPKALDISKQMDKRSGAERKNIRVAGKSGSRRNSMRGDFTGGEYMETAPSTEEAKQWSGWKSHGLKPAYEPILVAMKPNDKTYADNALEWGVSGFNIDECRIDYKGEKPNVGGRGKHTRGDGYGFKELGDKIEADTKGRFPANIILDEEAGKMLDEQQKGASRFFYCAKSSKSEKNAGYGQSDKSSTDIKDVEKRFTTQPVSNNHPTVKPLKLMEYLCKLTKTPTGGIVLDPFAGSCTTACACINTGRDYIMIEQDKDYCEIGKARIKHYEEK